MQQMNDKAKPIRLLILDVDGVLTSGLIYYTDNGMEAKGFCIHDGMGIKLLQRADIPVAIISGKKSPAVGKRCRDLAIKHYYLGHSDKIPAYEELKQTYKVTDNEIAYMGDDLPDLPLLKRAGLAITVPQAPECVKKTAHMVTKAKGGEGAVREICDFILMAQDKFDSLLEHYLTK